MKQYKTPSIKSDISETPIIPIVALLFGLPEPRPFAAISKLVKSGNIRQMPEKNLSSF